MVWNMLKKIQECNGLHQQASLFQQLGINDRAIDFYNRALEKDYTYIPAMVNKIALFISSNQLQKAIDIAISTLRIDPECTDAWNNLANVFYTIRQKEKAIDFYNEALRIDPN
jgi:tetratricopeptide (TPR) repeat protein